MTLPQAHSEVRARETNLASEANLLDETMRKLGIDPDVFVRGRVAVIRARQLPKIERGAMLRCPETERRGRFSWYAGRHYQHARFALSEVTVDFRHVERKHDLALVFWNLASSADLSPDRVEASLSGSP